MLSKFSRIAAHLRAWLVRIREHLITIGVEQNVWVVFAAFYLLGCVPCLIGCVPCLIGCVPCLIGCVPSNSWLCAFYFLAVCPTVGCLSYLKAVCYAIWLCANSTLMTFSRRGENVTW